MYIEWNRKQKIHTENDEKENTVAMKIIEKKRTSLLKCSSLKPVGAAIDRKRTANSNLATSTSKMSMVYVCAFVLYTLYNVAVAVMFCVILSLSLSCALENKESMITLVRITTKILLRTGKSAEGKEFAEKN